MPYEMVIFDLDGTIINSQQGFVNSVNYALSARGFEPKKTEDLLQFIGPSLEISFGIMAETQDEDLIHSLIVKYRENYADTGFQEIEPYAGMVETLEKFHTMDHVRLGVCTSKRTEFAIKNLEKCGLIDYFDFVSGAGVGTTKSQQLEILLADGKAPQNSIMIGDRLYDMHAAQDNNLHKAGVLWGFGSHSELSEYEPQFMFDQPNQLLQLADAK